MLRSRRPLWIALGAGFALASITAAARTAEPPAAAATPAAVATSPPVGAGIGAREQALQARHAAGTLAADFIQLGDESQAFLARYQPPARQPVAPAVLFVPGQGRIVATDPMVAALLRAFEHADNAVLVPQLPLAATTAAGGDLAALAAAAGTRLEVALAHLRAQGAPAVVVIGEDEGAALAARYVADAGGTGLAGFAALGTWEGSLPAFALPVFEVVPEQEPAAMRLATARRVTAGAAKRRDYVQLRVAGAGRHHPVYAAEIASRVRGWVARHAAVGPQAPAVAIAGR